MSTNYCHPRRNMIFKVLILLFLLAPLESYALNPAYTEAIQEETVSSVGTVSTEETKNATETAVTVDKKKDKIQLNQNFYISLIIDLATIVLIIALIYYPNYKKMDTIFTFIMFNVTIFLLTFVLNKVKISMGAAFGLFAVFSMLRYRTSGINVKDMTYLFLFIALGLISGIQLDYYELGIIAGIIFLMTLLLDTKLVMKKEISNILRYEKIEMIKPEKREELIAELKERTGLDIHRISINEIDYLKDTAMITYYYYEN